MTSHGFTNSRLNAGMLTVFTAVLAACLGPLGPSEARAQTLPTASLSLAAAAQQPAPAPPPPAPRVVGGQDGFAIESADGSFRLQLGLLVHADGRFSIDDPDALYVNTFSVRRLRPYLRGRVGRRFEFSLNPDFAGGTLVIQDAYLDTLFSPAVRVRVGKSKTPFGLERLHSASNLLFLERALPTALVPNRDVGVHVLGDIGGGVVSYQVGLVNGVADGASGDGDTNDNKDVALRLSVRPFRRLASSPLAGLGLAVSGTTGRAGALPTLRTATLQQPFFSYATGAAADGDRTRYSPQLWYFQKAFGAWAEYVHTTTPLRRGTVTADVDHTAWQVAASVVLTGETATDAGSGVRPRAPFDPAARRWGAFQLAARYHVLEVDGDAVDLGLASTGSSCRAEAWTVGLRWLLSANLSHTLNVERTDFDGVNARKPETALTFRTQLSF